MVTNSRDVAIHRGNTDCEVIGIRVAEFGDVRRNLARREAFEAAMKLLESLLQRAVLHVQNVGSALAPIQSTSALSFNRNNSGVVVPAATATGGGS